MSRISAVTETRGLGANPTSCIARHATTNVRTSNAARTRYGVPRLVDWANTPPAIVPPTIAMPPATCPLANADSSDPWYPLAASPSTSQASVAPLKKVKPSPSSADATAQGTNPAFTCHSSR